MTRSSLFLPCDAFLSALAKDFTYWPPAAVSSLMGLLGSYDIVHSRASKIYVSIRSTH